MRITGLVLFLAATASCGGDECRKGWSADEDGVCQSDCQLSTEDIDEDGDGSIDYSSVYSYDDDDRVSLLEARQPDGSLRRTVYTRDPAGNPITVELYVNGVLLLRDIQTLDADDNLLTFERDFDVDRTVDERYVFGSWSPRGSGSGSKRRWKCPWPRSTLPTRRPSCRRGPPGSQALGGARGNTNRSKSWPRAWTACRWHWSLPHPGPT